jgi:hypothetical protein
MSALRDLLPARRTRAVSRAALAAAAVCGRRSHTFLATVCQLVGADGRLLVGGRGPVAATRNGPRCGCAGHGRCTRGRLRAVCCWWAWGGAEELRSDANPDQVCVCGCL